MRGALRVSVAVLAAVSAVGLGAAIAEEATLPPEVVKATEDVNARTALAHIRFLASDELEGRASPSRGLDVAARYIAAEFERYGLEPAGEDGSYFQTFHLERVGLVAGSSVEVTRPAAGEAYSIPIDGVAASAFSFSGEGEVVNAPVVFAGYGIQSRRPAYDDYKGIDVEGKVVVCLRHEPQERDEKSPFAGTEATRGSFLQVKYRTAVKRGAAAFILVTDPGNHKQDAMIQSFPSIEGLHDAKAADEGDEGGDERVPGEPDAAAAEEIPAIHLSQKAASQLFAESGLDLAALQAEIDRTLEPRSRELQGVALSLRVGIEAGPVAVRNVAAILRGGDVRLADEFVVAGAHYDHVGTHGHGPAGAQLGETDPAKDGIFNGADDNASGTAALLESARILGSLDRPPALSVLFLAFAGEELGLLGSVAYCRAPLIPLDQTVGMVNLDMVGRNKTESMQVSGAKTYALFERLLERANAAPSIGFELRLSRGIGDGSDHVSFIRAGVPAIHLFSGFHDDYHAVGDHTDKINAEKVARAARLTALTAWLLAESEEKPERPEARAGARREEGREGGEKEQGRERGRLF